MSAMPLGGPHYDDPLRLRELLLRYTSLASQHQLRSVLVGLSAPEGDLDFPGLLDYLDSALRVDDRIFRMTRERAVLFLADADRALAEAIVDRNVESFRGCLPAAGSLPLRRRYVEVTPESADLCVKGILPALFSDDPSSG